jgi:hypothetical protein
MIAATTSKAIKNVGKGVSKANTLLPTKPLSNNKKLAKKDVIKEVFNDKTVLPTKTLTNIKASKDPKNLITRYMVTTDTLPGTTEAAKKMREVPNNIQIRQKDVDHFTDEE